MVDIQGLKHICKGIIFDVSRSPVVGNYKSDILIDVSTIMRDKPDFFMILLRSCGTEYLDLSSPYKHEETNKAIESFYWWMKEESTRSGETNILKDNANSHFIACLNCQVSHVLRYNDVIRILKVYYTGNEEIKEIEGDL
jgi:hypothetical protein